MPLPALIAIALKLAPLVASVVPEAVRALAGPKAGEAAEKIVGIAETITGAKGEDATAIILKDPAKALEFQQALIAERLELRRLDLEETKAYLADTQGARTANAGDRGVFWLGISILVTYGLILGAALFGAYWLLVEGELASMDVGTVAAVFTLIGTIVGYIASDAKQVVSYYFGSSRGSQDKSTALSDAFKNLSK